MRVGREVRQIIRGDAILAEGLGEAGRVLQGHLEQGAPAQEQLGALAEHYLPIVVIAMLVIGIVASVFAP